ncbi:MAG: copper resistance protein NlpE N-terminal domain-containing protein [Chloroflexi bacterium]|nr:copper resistance protein NlpE N-terminal domain-containing protein [Chloroflexota bacterium]
MPQIPADTHCEQMIWKFVLYQDPATGTPTTYTLKSAYGVPQQGTPGLAGGGTAIGLEGSWAIVKGTKLDPDAVVYQLNSDNPPTTVSFLRMSEDILHILASDQTLMVGNASWSYTLNRTDNRIPSQATEPPGSATEASTWPAIPPRPPGASILGIFEGRLPCHEIVFEFTKIAPYPGCTKMKSRLTLYRDQKTGAPSTYLYMGTSTIREGTWTIVRGTESDPDEVMYQLHLDNSQQPVSFLKADENHLFLLDRAGNLLVGDALFSYTLSRTDKGAQ